MPVHSGSRIIVPDRPTADQLVTWLRLNWGVTLAIDAAGNHVLRRGSRVHLLSNHGAWTRLPREHVRRILTHLDILADDHDDDAIAWMHPA